jgi:hypothetical protein
VCLGPPGNLEGFRESADITDIQPDKVRQAAFDERQERPLGVELFAYRKRDVGHRP